MRCDPNFIYIASKLTLEGLSNEIIIPYIYIYIYIQKTPQVAKVSSLGHEWV